MKRLLALIPALVLAAPVFAQEAPAEAYNDLWCGLAFVTAASAAPYSAEDLTAARAAGDAATDAQKDIVAQAEMAEGFIEGGEGLIAKAEEGYLAAGFSADRFASTRTELGETVNAQISGPAAGAEFTFEQCIVRLPQDGAAPTP